MGIGKNMFFKKFVLGQRNIQGVNLYNFLLIFIYFGLYGDIVEVVGFLKKREFQIFNMYFNDVGYGGQFFINDWQ